ncbi:MAG: glycoside hydrolase domain-containing protein [Verrucomicrobiota bacterium]
MKITRYSIGLLLLGALPILAATATVPWPGSLYLANHGYWRLRVPVQVANDGTDAVVGEPVSFTVPALAGARVESLRVCRPDGVELLFDLRDARGGVKRTGQLAVEDQLIVPAECEAKATAPLFVYAGNDQAWAVPDFLPAGFRNGSFETGEVAPEAWVPAMTDEQHVLTWEKNGGRNGSRCVKAEVAAGAPATWVQWQQTQLPVTPGRTYQLRAWVRADNVTGYAGWYIHVYGERGEVVNQTLNAGSGAFDWKLVSVTFTAPTNARSATIGTVLRGTGRAWFDDAEFIEGGGKSALRVLAGPVERLELKNEAVTKIKPGPDFLNRAEVVARNFSERTASPALVRVNLNYALARLPGVSHQAAIRVLAGHGGEVPSYRLGRGGDLLIATELAARSEQWFHVGFGPAARPEATSAQLDYQRLLDSPANLVTNGSFERGTDAPENFIKPKSGAASKVTAGFSPDAKFGQRSLELAVPENTKKDWVGWNSQPIRVKPGATYLLSGWLKGLGLKSSATMHAHFHDANGVLCKSGAMASTSPNVSGDSEWVNSTGLLTAPSDAAKITLHLTMNTSGTLRHDGILLCEVMEGQIEHVLSATGSAPPPNQPLQVWEVNPLVKVFPDTPPQVQSQGVQVELAKNEFEPFQLALRGRFGAAFSNVLVRVSSLKNSAGTTLPPVNVETVGFVPIDHPSGYYTTDVPDWYRKVPRGSSLTDGWAGEWPDPLVPSASFPLATNRTQPVWLTVRAPRDAAPGEYRGEINVLAEGKLSTTLPLSVMVHPFTLPERTRLQVIFDFRRGPGGWYGPTGDAPGEREKWLRFIAAHRLGISGIEPPPKFTYKDGKVSMDTTEFDVAAKFCFEELGMNVSYTPQFFYMFGWAYPPKKFFGFEPFTPEWTSAFQQAYRLFTDHVCAKGWHDKFVYYISDEPHFTHEFVVEQMKKLCAIIHEVDGEIPIYSSTWQHCPAWDNALDLWGVGQYGCFPVAEMERLQKRGKTMLFTCDGQQATDTPYLATERMLPYYCLKYGMKGFEFWGLSWWTYDPWKLGWHWFIRQSDDGKRHYWIRYPNGDGFLSYPGQRVGVDGPVSTIRFEQIREGLEDFEAMSLLKELMEKASKSGRSTAAGERALTLAKDLVVIPNAGGPRSTEILADPDQIPRIRKAVNAAIVELGK